MNNVTTTMNATEIAKQMRSRHDELTSRKQKLDAELATVNAELQQITGALNVFDKNSSNGKNKASKRVSKKGTGKPAVTKNEAA